MASKKIMSYGMYAFVVSVAMYTRFTNWIGSVRLGNSGLKVSRIILGCMSYGDPRWLGWVLPEEEAVKHIKFACVSNTRGGSL